MKKIIWGVLGAALVVVPMGCTTPTRKYAAGEVRQTVAGFSEADILETITRAVREINQLYCIRELPHGARAVMIVENVVNDTNSRGRDAGVLAENLGQTLREQVVAGGKVVVYNAAAAQGAAVQIKPQYKLVGRLTERNLRQDNGDYQKEYSLNITLIELATGLELWQKRLAIGKEVDADNVMN